MTCLSKHEIAGRLYLLQMQAESLGRGFQTACTRLNQCDQLRPIEAIEFQRRVNALADEAAELVAAMVPE